MTTDKLKKGRKILVNWCCLCERAYETCNHLFLWCLVHSLWSMAYRLFRVNWVVAGALKEELWAWKGFAKRKKSPRLVSLAILWVVWKERNKIVFEVLEESIDGMRERWFQILGLLVIGKQLYYMEDLGEFIDIIIDL